MIEQLAEKVNANAALVRRGQYLDTTFLLQVGSDGWLITVEKGRIASVRREGPSMVNHAFALRASRDAWTEFWQRVPKPGFHDLPSVAEIIILLQFALSEHVLVPFRQRHVLWVERIP